MVTQTAVIEQVERVARPLLASQGFDLVEVRYAGGRRRGVLRIFIDKIGGVTVDDCGRVSQILSTALDVEDIISHHYILEVSSPGLDRPLTALRDFLRHEGRLVRVATATRGAVTGRVLEADDEGITLGVEGGGRLQVPHGEIRSARLMVEWTDES